jgi:hypothetical protein
MAMAINTKGELNSSFRMAMYAARPRSPIRFSGPPRILSPLSMLHWVHCVSSSNWDKGLTALSPFHCSVSSAIVSGRVLSGSGYSGLAWFTLLVLGCLISEEAAIQAPDGSISGIFIY